MHSWRYWRDQLAPEQQRYVRKYYKRFKNISHPTLSTLCSRGYPAHHSDYAVNEYLKASDWKGRSILPKFNQSIAAHHITGEKGGCLYYVSQGPNGLLAFDIDSEGKSDALDYAAEIQN